MRRIVVIGGGIAGCESALTIARTVPNASVTVISPKRDLRLLPDLVYVPFGIPPQEITVPLRRALAPWSIDIVEGTCDEVDTRLHTVRVGEEWIDYDALVVATGIMPPASHHAALRSLHDAEQLRVELLQATGRARTTSVMVRILPGATWAAPSIEFLMLTHAWAVAQGIRHKLELAVATDEQHLLSGFGIDASELIERQLEKRGIEILRGVPSGRVEDFEADILIDIPPLMSRRIPGLAFLEDGTGNAPDIYTAGDVSNTPFTSAFGATWRARQVARTLGGDLSRLGDMVDGIPTTMVEYQMDLGNGSIHVRFDAEHRLFPGTADTRSRAWLSTSSPDKLRGTLIREILTKIDALPAGASEFRERLELIADPDAQAAGAAIGTATPRRGYPQ